MSTIDRGMQRFRRFKDEHKRRFGTEPKGKLLDFGCGAGAFVISAYRDGFEVSGVEVEPDREIQFKANALKHEPPAQNCLTMYDGGLLPFSSCSFDACYSWFVFEHVVNPQISLREIVRVLKPGGTLSIHADDVRNCWDGHAMMPWPPYLPREFASAYAEGLGIPDRAAFLSEQVVYISSAMIMDILETLGMKIVYANHSIVADKLLATDGLLVTNEEEARELGKRVLARQKFDPPNENLSLFAVKGQL